MKSKLFREKPIFVRDTVLWTKAQHGVYGFIIQDDYRSNFYHFDQKRWAKYYLPRCIGNKHNKITLLKNGQEVKSWD